MATAKFAKGYEFFIDGVKVHKMLDDGIPNPKVEDEEVDATTQDSGDWEESIAGRKTGGTVTFRCLYDEDSQGQVDLENAWAEDPKTNHEFKVKLPFGTYVTYRGWVKSFENPVIDKKIGIEAVIRVTGSVVRSETHAALTTPYFAVKDSTTNTAITGIVPAPGAEEGEYVVPVPAGTDDIDITPTSTSGTIEVNGVAVTSGADSTAITLGAAGTITRATIKVREAGKVLSIYRLILARAAS
jgi:hypothetical protein